MILYEDPTLKNSINIKINIINIERKKEQPAASWMGLHYRDDEQTVEKSEGPS